MSDLTAIEWTIGLVSVFMFVFTNYAAYRVGRMANYDVTIWVLSLVGSVWLIFKLLGFE